MSLVVGALRGSGDEAVVDNRRTPYSVTCRILFPSPVSVVRCLHSLDLLKRAPLATSLASELRKLADGCGPLLPLSSPE